MLCVLHEAARQSMNRTIPSCVRQSQRFLSLICSCRANKGSFDWTWPRVNTDKAFLSVWDSDGRVIYRLLRVRFYSINVKCTVTTSEGSPRRIARPIKGHLFQAANHNARVHIKGVWLGQSHVWSRANRWKTVWMFIVESKAGVSEDQHLHWDLTHTHTHTL